MSSIKLGLEVEFFFVDAKKRILDASLLAAPHDGMAILAEARGEPSVSAFHAVGSVRAEIDRIVHNVKAQHPEAKAKPMFADWVEKDEHVKALISNVWRRGSNKTIAWRNLHGLAPSAKCETHLNAGLHITFSKEGYLPPLYFYNDGHAVPYVNKVYTTFDYAHIFSLIEKEFLPEIEKSERTKGFYEVKDNGMVEYRSLPATLIHEKNFATRLSNALKGEL